LGGENRNFRLDAADGRQFVIKLSLVDPAGRAGLEEAAIACAAPALPDVALPRAIRSRSGQLLVSYPRVDGRRWIRVLAYLAGTPWESSPPAGAGRLRHLGDVLARLDRALEGFDSEGSADTHHWDLTAAAQHRPRVNSIETASRRTLAELMFHRWAALAEPRLRGLRQSFIHGDANDENVLVDGDRVVALLDFGDALRNPTACELAIALAYVMLETPDPLAAAGHVVAGYHAIRPLDETELDVLYPLVCGRLATTVVTAANRRSIDPYHASWFVTETKAWRLIERLAEVDPARARAAWDPLGTASSSAATPVPSAPDLLAGRVRHISRALSIAYQRPLHIVEGRGQYLIDERGRPFLDLVNNVAHVGHGHPRVVEAGQRQMARLNTNTRYLYPQLNDYAERLAATLPDPLRVCFLVNSGSEANELALRLARAHTGRRDVLVVEGAYHGNTGTLVALSPYKFMGKGGAGAPERWVHVAPVPDAYRRGHASDPSAAEIYGQELEQVLQSSPSPIGAFLVETLMSCAGQVVPPPGYLDRAFGAVRAAGGVCIADEVQVGFGRVGTRFWGFELHDVVPDIVVMGKPIGNGHPMGAVVTTREIAASFENGMEFFSTFGGNPVSCAIGMAVLDVIRDERLQAHAATVGAHFLTGLWTLAARHALIGDVRGAGLFLGVELVRDRGTREPATAEAAHLVNRMKERGVLLSTDGPFENVLKIKPPMVLTTSDVDMVVRMLDEELGG